MAGACPCCHSNKIPRPCFFGGEEDDGGSPSSLRHRQNLPPWLGPSLTRTRSFYPQRQEGMGMEVRGEDFSRGREGKAGWRWSFFC